MNTGQPRANKTDAGNGSKAICRVSNVLRSPSPDPRRSGNPAGGSLALIKHQQHVGCPRAFYIHLLHLRDTDAFPSIAEPSQLAEQARTRRSSATHTRRAIRFGGVIWRLIVSRVHGVLSGCELLCLSLCAEPSHKSFLRSFVDPHEARMLAAQGELFGPSSGPPLTRLTLLSHRSCSGYLHRFWA